MPELPEVETVVRGLSKNIIGQKIKSIDIKNARSFLWSPKIKKPNGAFGLTIRSLSRRGKGIIINLNKDYSLLIHLKMTGQLIYVPGSPMSERSASGSRMTKNSRHSREGGNPDRLNLGHSILRSTSYGGLRRLNFGHPTGDFVEEMPSSHTRIIFELSKGVLYFNDQRKFGWVKLIPAQDIEKDPFIKRLGFEPLSPSFTKAVLWRAIQKHPNSSIKGTLLDQSLIAGIGNIYADEALFESGIRPDRKGKTITSKENAKLIAAIKKVLKLGVKHAGTSIANYKNAEGLPGRMQNYLKVYQKDGDNCPSGCGQIKKIRVAGRGTHFCPICQH